MRGKKVVYSLIIFMMIMNFFAPVGQVFAAEDPMAENSLNQPVQENGESTNNTIPTEGEGIEQQAPVSESNLNQGSGLPSKGESTATAVSFNDPVLEAEVRKNLGIQEGEVTTADLENLYSLSAPDLGISDLTGLESAINLTTLDLSGNNISSVEPIIGLKNFKDFNLADNPVTTNSGIDEKDTQEIQFTQETEINDLEAKNSHSIGYVYINDFKNNDHEAQFSWEYDGENEPTSYKIYLNGNEVIEVTERSYTLKGLQPNTDYWLKVAAVRDGEVTEETGERHFTTFPIPSGDIVNFDNINLENAVRNELMVFDRDLRQTDLESLTRLYANGSNISSLKGLEYAKNLLSLGLGNNSISNIDTLSNLTNLIYLDISNNPIEDIANLPNNIEAITLSGTRVQDISVLLDMSNLFWVDIRGTEIDYINDTAALSVIHTLLDKGVQVEYRNLGYFSFYEDSVHENSIEVDWDFHERGEGQPTSYKVFLNNVELDEVTETSYTFSNLIPDTEYSIRIAAVRDGVLTGEETNRFIRTLAPPSGDVVTFIDPNLEDVVRQKLSIIDRELKASDLERLNWLDLGNKGITSLEGLQYAVNLYGLYAGSNQITDLKPISNLTNLQTLDLSYNPIDTIVDISNLEKISSLNISGTNVTDISPVLNYTGLYWLGIRESGVSETDPNTKSVLEELKARGVDIYFKNPGHISTWGTINENSIKLDWQYYKGDYDSPTSYKIYLNGLEITEVQQSPYTISGLDPATSYEVTINGVKDSELTGEESVSTYTTRPLPTGEIVTIEDPDLEEAIRNQVGVNERALRESDLALLTNFYLYSSEIKSLSGLEYAVNLEQLNIHGGQIRDLTPLQSLKSLKSLYLNYTKISDISLLSQLTSLERLSLWGNRIIDISGLSNLTKLVYLDLSSNGITDLTPLSHLTNLSNLHLSNNPASNLEPLKALTNLIELSLYNMPLDLSEGSSAAMAIQYLRENGVNVYTTDGYYEELFLDTYNVTDTSVDMNWFGNFLPENVESTKIKVYSYGETIVDDVYTDVYDDVYDDVYNDVYDDVYGDVYGESELAAEYDVTYSDYSYTVSGLNPSTHYKLELSVVLKDGSEVSASNYIQTQWSKDNAVENVAFKVVDQKNASIPNLEVSIEGADENNKDVFLYGYTNQNGEFQSWYHQGTTLALPVGKYDVFVYGNEKYGSTMHTVNVTKDGVFPIEIKLSEIQVEKTNVNIEVTDSQGNPVTSLKYISLYSGKTVRSFGHNIGSYNEWELHSDNGRYQINDVALAEDYILNVEGKGYRVYSEEKLEIGQDAAIKVVLDKGSELKAKVTTPDGQLLTGAGYTISGETTNVYGSLEESGAIHALGLNEEDLTIEISMPGYLTYKGTISASQFDNKVAQLDDIVLQPEQFIDGHVYKSKADEPVKHAYVQLFEEGSRWSSYSTRTDADGYFKVRNVKPGKYKVRVEAYNLPVAEEFDIAAGSTIDVFLSQQSKGAFSGEGNNFVPSKSNAVPGDTVEYRLNYSNGSQNAIENAKVSFTLPDTVELIADSLLTSTTNVNTSSFAKGRSLTLNKVDAGEKGTISFKVKVKDTAEENIVSTATIQSGSEEVNLNSSMGLTFVTLNGPEVTSEANVKVYGSAKPGSVVKVYDGNALLVETTVPINSRWWYADIQLPVKTGEKSAHQLVAKVSDLSQTAASAPIKIEYNPSVPKLSDLSISAGWNNNVSLNPYTGVATMAIVEYTPIKIKAKFDQTIDKAKIHYLGENYSFRKNGDQWEASIPGDWSSYGEQLMELTFEKNGQIIRMPILQVIVLIDPSGYVFEGSMQNRLSGVNAVVEQQQENGAWKPWNAAAFGQVNPQVTDDEGRYGWDVIQGTWRVIFTKEGYDNYTSRNVYVPPAETQLNVPLVRKSNPLVEELSMADGATDSAPNTPIKIKFDRLMDESTLKNIQVTDSNGNVAAGNISGNEHLFGYKEVEGKPGFFEEDQTKLLSKTVTWEPSEKLTGGEYTLTIPVSVKDYSGKALQVSKTITFTVKESDITAPVKPVVNEVTDETIAVTGTAEAGATVDVKSGEKILGNSTAKADGTFEVTIAKQNAGTELVITAKDAAGNVSDSVTIVVKQREGWKPQNGIWKFYESGKYVTGWKFLGVNWYYFNSDGEMQTGWEFTGGKWYFFEPGGAMQTGWKYIGGKYYYFEPGGVMQTGWKYIGGKYYYLEPGGTMQTGWIYVGDKYYYLDESGAMQTGWVNLGGYWYHLDDSGAMNTGWRYLGGNWYYLNSSGTMATGWKQIGTIWYYFYYGGAMAHDTIIDGYKISSSGVWVQ